MCSHPTLQVPIASLNLMEPRSPSRVQVRNQNRLLLCSTDIRLIERPAINQTEVGASSCERWMCARYRLERGKERERKTENPEKGTLDRGSGVIEGSLAPNCYHDQADDVPSDRSGCDLSSLASNRKHFILAPPSPFTCPSRPNRGHDVLNTALAHCREN